MLSCPNKNLQEWKDLVTKTGDEDIAYYKWNTENMGMNVSYQIDPEVYTEKFDQFVSKMLTNTLTDYNEILDASIEFLQFDDSPLDGFEKTALFKKYHDKSKYTKGRTYELAREFITDKEVANLDKVSNRKRRRYYKHLRKMKEVKIEAFQKVVNNRELLAENKQANSIFNKVVEAFKRFMRALVGDIVNFQEVSQFEKVADDIINSAKAGQLYVNITPEVKAGYKRINFNETVDNSPIGKEVISKLGQFKGVLTGSLAYAPYGNIYRDASNVLHDIDILYDKPREEAFKDFKEVFPNAKLIYDIDGRLFTFIVPQEGATVKNLSRRGEGSSLVIGYEVWRDGEQVGTFELDYDTDEQNRPIDRIENKTGEEATFVDIFYNETYSPHIKEYQYNQHKILLNDPVEGFKQKLDMARGKDVNDFLLFGDETVITPEEQEGLQKLKSLSAEEHNNNFLKCNS